MIRETNGLGDMGGGAKGYHAAVTHKIQREVYWTAKGLRVTRLRLLSDVGFPCWDVSYCHGFIGDEPVHVQLPFGQLNRGNLSRQIIEYAKQDGVYAKGLGILDSISTLV